MAARPRSAPAGDVYALVGPAGRRETVAKDDGPRRIRPAAALGAAGVVVLAGGLATPFLLTGPFGAPREGSAVAAPVRPATVTTYVPTVSGRAPVVPGPAASTAAPSVTATTASATPGPASTARPTTTAGRPTTAAGTTRTTRRATVTQTVTATVQPTTTQPSTRPGEVYVDPAQYLGRQEDPVRAELEARGLDTADSWAFDTGRPRGTVVELRPSGWVRDGGDVRVYVAWS